ncbi:Subtilase family protein [Dyella sp. OK004]|uniref:S8 family serine peptidase n=1 Tax=Dyella sp. OK004 TaxID=1855292 RepID=UPI0008E4BFF2|nr:S8 family serine peptidase [Dyella sp. OK004]SFS19976.1 Subtilase family protein [Dyella sp. OK004]
MKLAVLAMLVVTAALSACTLPRPTTPRPTSVESSTDHVLAMDPARDIVLAVANPLEPPATHAGSSVLGYAPAGNYGAGQRAVSTLTALKKTYGIRQITGWPIKALDLYCIVLEPPAGMTREALLAALAKDARVQLAQPLQDYAVYADTQEDGHRYNDPYADLQHGFVETDAAVAHNVSRGDGVHIAIVDTGANTAHPDLQGSIGEVRDFVDADAPAFNHDSHGTEVAGIIAAVGDNHQGIVGMAPGATLNIYKACWYPPSAQSGAHCNSFTLAKALAAVIDTKARIVNLSLGGPADPLLNQLLGHLLRQGRIVIAASPPEGDSGGFPNDVPGVIVVRASNASTAPPGVLSAPGKDILTTQPNGGYDFTSGSSMAAAHVSGIAALLLSLTPGLDARAIHELMLDSSKVSNHMLQVNAAAAIAMLRARQKSPH